jgi:hypothetical protein
MTLKRQLMLGELVILQVQEDHKNTEVLLKDLDPTQLMLIIMLQDLVVCKLKAKNSKQCMRITELLV